MLGSGKFGAGREQPTIIADEHSLRLLLSRLGSGKSVAGVFQSGIFLHGFFELRLSGFEFLFGGFGPRIDWLEPWIVGCGRPFEIAHGRPRCRGLASGLFPVALGLWLEGGSGCCQIFLGGLISGGLPNRRKDRGRRLCEGCSGFFELVTSRGEAGRYGVFFFQIVDRFLQGDTRPFAFRFSFAEGSLSLQQ